MIISYEYKGPASDPWHFTQTNYGKINLLVGASGSGKTRFLNTLFNFATTVVNAKPFRTGNWIIKVLAGDVEYSWEYEGLSEDSLKREISKELLKRKTSENVEETLVERTADYFNFCGTSLPKLQRDILSVTLLKEEAVIEPLFKIFAHIQRREFHTAGLQDAIAVQNVPSHIFEHFKNNPNLEDLWSQDHAVSAKMFLFKNFFPNIYEQAIRLFREVFPSVEDADVRFAQNMNIPLRPEGSLPIFTVKEKGIKKWLPLSELSSGMQKVLLIISDVLSLPRGSIYIIDEYENSLGVNAIDFLPQFLIDYGAENQFFVTTHHPYLINSMPIKNWSVFNRKGSIVTVKRGSELEERFGKSKQKAFIQLMNDPFYAEVS